MKWLDKLSKGNILFYFLLLFFGIEFLNKIQVYFWDTDFMIQKFIKLVALAFMLLYLLFKDSKKIYWLSALVFLFILGQYFLPDSFALISVIGFGRYFFFLVIIVFFHPFIKTTRHESQKVFGLWEKLLWLNNTVILIGLVFSLEIFRSYSGERWGYNGLLMASSNSTYFYIAGFVYFLIRYKETYFKKPLFWLTLIASLCTGTKSVYLGILLLGIVGLLNLNLKKKLKIVMLIGVLLAGFVCMSVLFTTGVFARIVERDGWLSAILSFRDQLFIIDTIPYIQQNWSTIHYFIGGLSNPFARPQMELIDLFLYFGAFGSLLFLYIFIKYYFDMAIDRYEKICILILLLIPIITGNFFYNASVPIYLIVLKLAVIKSQGKKNRLKTKSAPKVF